MLLPPPDERLLFPDLPELTAALDWLPDLPELTAALDWLPELLELTADFV